ARLECRFAAGFPRDVVAGTEHRARNEPIRAVGPARTGEATRLSHEAAGSIFASRVRRIVRIRIVVARVGAPLERVLRLDLGAHRRLVAARGTGRAIAPRAAAGEVAAVEEAVAVVVAAVAARAEAGF